MARWTAWVAFASWWIVVREGLRRPATGHGPVVRVVWLAGGLLMLLHTILAFHFVHDWSHRAAVIETARQTRALTGIAVGAGVWLNYLFTILWVADAMWWWVEPAASVRSAHGWRWSVHGFLAFMWFNATVVFGTTPAGRIVCGIAFLWLVIEWLRNRAAA